MRPEMPKVEFPNAAEFHMKSIRAELDRAWKLYPRPFVNAHEAHSVILEEFREFEREVFIKAADRNQSLCRLELIQLAAMCLRALIEVDWHAP